MLAVKAAQGVESSTSAAESPHLLRRLQATVLRCPLPALTRRDPVERRVQAPRVLGVGLSWHLQNHKEKAGTHLSRVAERARWQNSPCAKGR